MRGADVGSSNAAPLCIIPDVGQVPKNDVKPPSNERWDVFHDDEAGSKLANDASILTPQPGSFAVKPSAFAGVTEILTGEAAADEVDGGKG
jgi:hypothetical protein